jgi:LysR family hydrogen peroxide-inducible transcriptional activator
MLKDYPKIKLNIHEITTSGIIDKIYNDELDAGIVATPIEQLKLQNQVLYYEEFMAYSSHDIAKDYILPSDIKIDDLWLLEEGHCLRSQILNLCELKASKNGPISYNAGSIDTLLNLVDGHGGITIVPELTVIHMSQSRKKRLSLFSPPAPVREISMISHKSSHKNKQIAAIINTIDKAIPAYMKDREDHLNPPISLG